MQLIFGSSEDDRSHRQKCKSLCRPGVWSKRVALTTLRRAVETSNLTRYCSANFRDLPTSCHFSRYVRRRFSTRMRDSVVWSAVSAANGVRFFAANNQLWRQHRNAVSLRATSSVYNIFNSVGFLTPKAIVVRCIRAASRQGKRPCTCPISLRS